MLNTTTAASFVNVSSFPTLEQLNQSLWSSTTTTTATRRQGPLPPDGNFRMALYILMGIVALIGIIGNVCVCFIVIRGKKMYTIANLFLMNLAVADIFVLTICYPLTIIRNEMNWPFGEVLCKILPSISDSFYGVSMGCITAISIYRYRMILHSMTTHVSFKHAKITLIVIWILALCVISVPLCWVLKLESMRMPIAVQSNGSLSSIANETTGQAFFNGNASTSINATIMQYLNRTSNKTLPLASAKSHEFVIIRKCISRWPTPKFREIYQIVQVSWYILPLSVILFTYLRIRTYLKKTLLYEWTKTGDNKTSQTGLSARVMGIKRALTLLAPVVVTFAILMFPWNLFRFLSLIMDLSKIRYIYSYLEIAGVMMIANSCSNPFIYYIMSKDFRDEFRRQFRLLTRCYKQSRGDTQLARCSMKSTSFRTKTEMIANEDSLEDKDAGKKNGFDQSYKKYSVKEGDSLLRRKVSKQFVAITSDLYMSTNIKEPLTVALYNPDRETIL